MQQEYKANVIFTCIYTVILSLCWAAPALADFQLSLDNDLFAPAQSDSGYTGGVHASLQKRRHLWNFGIVVYTPQDLSADHVIRNDRPYANLVYVSRSKSSRAENHVRQQTVAVGVLGSPAGEALQQFVHRATGSTRPSGFRHQISDGGELTARWGYTTYQHLGARTGDAAATHFLAERSVSLGYQSFVSLGIGFRRARWDFPWQHARNDFAAHFDERTIASRGNYYFGGARVRLSAYNVFLHGQFRRAAHRVSHADSRLPVFEAWMGAARQWRASQLLFSLHWQSAETRLAAEPNGQIWGRISIRPGQSKLQRKF